MKISVIGLGKLGTPLAAVLASKGHTVVGVDVNPDFVRLLASGKSPVEEPGIQKLVGEHRERLSATGDIEAAILATDVSFIIVPTPSDNQGGFSNRYVLSAIANIGQALKKKRDYHVVNVTSTVMPGSTGGEIRRALESSSAREVGATVGLCYNPEFVALGSVVRDMLFPDMILVGESDPRAGGVLAEIYQSVCENDPPVMHMNWVNAEITKISINTYVTTRISYANMLSDICERLPGADVDVVTRALGADSRIGKKYLKGALGYGGPCFPRDNVAFSHLARGLGARADLAEATDSLNRYQIERLAAAATRLLDGGSKVGILGLSYKPETAVIEESQGLALAARLSEDRREVFVHDPMALSAAMVILQDKVVPMRSAEECIKAVDVLVITTAWPQYASIPASAFARPQARLQILDCWRTLSRDSIAGVADIHYLGVCGPEPLGKRVRAVAG
ncbi:MAG: UDP-glucose/GDP-mannose dehydrogenase family protein [Candidatus Parcubacteria bacterium]|nr:UDP-glucose/GDP-mannose dehydrogenase family protein [Burkholderiales bacterium]